MIETPPGTGIGLLTVPGAHSAHSRRRAARAAVPDGPSRGRRRPPPSTLPNIAARSRRTTRRSAAARGSCWRCRASAPGSPAWRTGRSRRRDIPRCPWTRSCLSRTALTSSSPTLTPLSILARCSRCQAISPSIWRRIDLIERAMGLEIGGHLVGRLLGVRSDARDRLVDIRLLDFDLLGLGRLDLERFVDQVAKHLLAEPVDLVRRNRRCRWRSRAAPGAGRRRSG